MNIRKTSGTVMAGLVLASLVAPMAYADSGPWFRYRQGYGNQVLTPRYSYYHRHEGSGVGPAIGGLVAGLLIGSQIHSQPVVRERVVYVDPPVRERVIYSRPDYCPPGYNDNVEDCNYYDPYNNGWYGNLDQCTESAARYSEGPRFVVAISARTGECLNTFSWTGGGWRACGADSRWNGYSQYSHGGWDGRNYYNRYGDGGWKNNCHDNRGGRGHGRWSQGRDEDGDGD